MTEFSRSRCPLCGGFTIKYVDPEGRKWEMCYSCRAQFPLEGKGPAVVKEVIK